MPRIDLWAIAPQHEFDEQEDDSCVHMCDSADTIPCDAKSIASGLWNSFTEQVDSICLSASLIILATSEVPSEDLPHSINQFFTSNSLNLNGSSTSERAKPHFIVQVGGSFDFDMLINSSATQLSRDIVQQYVLLLHQRAYAALVQNENKPVYESHNTSSGTACKGTDDVIPLSDDHCPTMLQTTDHKEAEVEPEVRACDFQDTFGILCNNKSVKGKSSMLLAISSFGYQILRYPHFAELCWATSNLKEGPCADINGPWKGWPFNSCIVRPDSSLESFSLRQSSNNLKNKENFGVVRGLIAVGLLAYKGVYTSIREVSFEVRKVLELLVEELNAKILAGKDTSQFFYLLSQVAYLEDMVNSWAYTLQSLECDSSISVRNPGTTIEILPDGHRTSECNTVGGDVCKPKISQKSSDVNVQGESELIGSYQEVTCLDRPDSQAGVTTSVEPFQERTSYGSNFQASTLAINFLAIGNALDTQNTANNVEPKTKKSVDGVCTHDESNVMNSRRRKFSDECKDLSVERMVLRSNENAHRSDGQMEDVGLNVNKINVVTLSSVSRFTCWYSCCSKCTDMVYDLIRKILIHEWKILGSSWTLEDAHNAVCSWSTNLLSAVNKFYAVESNRESELMSKNATEETDVGLCTCSDVDQRRPNENSFHISTGSNVAVPVECSFHSKSKDVTESTSACTNSQFALGLKFCFKDNVLISSDLDKDALLHCKFQNLCLKSLIEWILMIKHPLT